MIQAFDDMFYSDHFLVRNFGIIQEYSYEDYGYFNVTERIYTTLTLELENLNGAETLTKQYTITLT